MIFLTNVPKPNLTKKGAWYVNSETQDPWFLKGFILHATQEQYRERFTKKRYTSLHGEFVLGHRNRSTVRIIGDRYSRETSYYFYDGEQFIFSDDFWAIIAHIEPKADSLLAQQLAEMVVVGRPLGHKTFIKHLHVLPPASEITFNCSTNTFTLSTYTSFRLKKKELTYEQALKDMDTQIKKSIRAIKDNYGADVSYGIGISGGLDSRVVAKYAVQEGLKLTGFIIGESKPRKLWLSRDHKNAQLIARHFNIPLTNVEVNTSPLIDRMEAEIARFPLGSSVALILPTEGVPSFDVLLTGAFAITMTTQAGTDIIEISDEELVHRIARFSFKMYKPISVWRRAYHLLTGKQARILEAGPRKGILTQEQYQVILEHIRDYIHKHKHLSNFEIYQSFVLNEHAPINKYGAYESLCGAVPAATIYYPYVAESARSWKPEFFNKRQLLKDFVQEYHPELLEFQLQDWRPKLHQTSVFRKIQSFLMFLIRWYGVMRAAVWIRRRDVQEYYSELMKRPNPYFDEYFDCVEIEKQWKHKKLNNNMYAELHKIKRMLDKIYYEEY